MKQFYAIVKMKKTLLKNIQKRKKGSSPKKFDNRWHYPRLILITAQMFADLENRCQNQRARAGIIKGSDQFGQNLILANFRRNLVQLFWKSSEESCFFLVVFDLDLFQKEKRVNQAVLEVSRSTFHAGDFFSRLWTLGSVRRHQLLNVHFI